MDQPSQPDTPVPITTGQPAQPLQNDGNSLLDKLKKKPAITLSLVAIAILIVWGLAMLMGKNSATEDGSSALEITGSRQTKTVGASFKDKLLSFSSKSKSATDTAPTDTDPTPTPSPTPTSLTPGPGVYRVSQGKHAGPTINQVTFDPLDVKVGQNLTITLRVLANTPAEKITGTLQTDSSVESLKFSKKSADGQYEIWSTKLKLKQSVLYKYILTVTAESETGEAKLVVAPRS